MADYLFVYGTLRPGHAPDEIADVVGSLKPIGEGSIKGTRYDLGDYPAVPHRGTAGGKVQGQVFELPENPEALARLDHYEEYDPTRPNHSLFRRTRVNVTKTDGTRLSSWVYLYNKPIPKRAMFRKTLQKRAAGASR